MMTLKILRELEYQLDKSKEEIDYLWGVRVYVPPTLTQQEIENLYDREVDNWKKLQIIREALFHIYYEVCTSRTTGCVLTQLPTPLPLSAVRGQL